MTKASILVLLISLLLGANYSKAQKIELVDYTLYPCEESYYIDYLYYQERIVDINLITDTLILLISTTMNCGSGDIAYINVDEDTVHLFSDSPDSVAILSDNGDTINWEEAEAYECTCCFTLEYKIKGILHKDYVISINGKVLEQLPNKYIFPIINKFGDTTVYIDEEGYFHKKTYNLLGRLLFERKQNLEYSNIKFYHQNGQLWKEEEFDKINRTGKTCEYDESGKLIEVEKYIEY